MVGAGGVTLAQAVQKRVGLPTRGSVYLQFLKASSAPSTHDQAMLDGFRRADAALDEFRYGRPDGRLLRMIVGLRVATTIHLLGCRGGADLSIERFNGWRRATLPLLGTTSGHALSQSPAVLLALAEQLEQRRPMPAFSVRLGRAELGAEAVVLPVRDPGPLDQLRAALRGGASDALGPDRVADRAPTFHPHLSVANVNRAAQAEPVQALLERVPSPETALDVRTVSLIELGRDDRQYTWTPTARVPLG